MFRWLSLCVLLCLGCNSTKSSLPQNPAVAIVGKDTIFLSDYKKQLNIVRTGETDLQNQSERVQLLNNIINSRLIEKFAIQEGFEKDDYVQFKTKTYEDEILYNRYVVSKLFASLISTEKVQEIANSLKTEVRLSHILIGFQSGAAKKIQFSANIKQTFRDKASAKQLADSLKPLLTKNPELFEKLAEEYSQDDNTKYIGGSLGLIRYEDLRKDWAEFVFNMKEHSFGVLESEAGYHIMNCLEKSDRKDLKPEEELALAENILLGQIASESSTVKMRKSFEDSLLESRKFKFDPAAIRFFLKKTSGLHASEFSADEKNEALAVFSDKSITIQDLIFAMADNQSKVILTEPLMEKGLRSAAKIKLIAELARNEGLTLNSYQQRKLENYKRNVASELATRTKTKVPESFTDAELSAFFEANKAKYRNPDSVRIAEISSKSIDTLNRYYDEFAKGRNFSDIFNFFKKGGHAQKHPWMSASGKSELLDRISGLKSNEVSKPFPYRDGFAMVRLDESKAGEAPLLSKIRGRLEKDIALSKSQALYSEWMISLRSKYRVESYPEELAKAYELRLK